MLKITCVSVALILLTACQAAPRAGSSNGPPESGQAAGEQEDNQESIAAKVEGLTRHEGLLTFYTDAKKGTVLLELPTAVATPEGQQFIYVESLAGGLGSNPVGLDRGQLGPSRLVTIRRVGGRVMIEEVNLRYRAVTDNEDERRAVRQSFATSVLWAGAIEAEDDDGTMLVDLTSFIMRDAHDVADTLRQSGQGDYSLDRDRSAVDVERCLAFPDNCEFEAVVTFAGRQPGGDVRSVTPTGESITLVQHHSFIRLPDDGYAPRRFDPRVAANSEDFLDYAAPLDAPMETKWINRHRLQKVSPDAARSPVVEPIVYYVDRGAPEPVRSALVEGASWWAEAFEEAGFENAFRVEVMPVGAHPLDVRYNVIQWVHRSTRGWSYGGSVTDPRTGEIIKGHVSLGSLRVRQDRLLFEGLAGVTNTGTGTPDDPVQLALARIRQLSAHEVGHTLGFAHNFAASTWGGRASVMDYPAPLVGINDDGTLDFSDAYDVGIGEWDRHCVRFAYSEFPPGADEQAELEAIVREGEERGYLFISDSDARPAGAAHPLANLWDNGDDPASALAHALRVRAIALSNFDRGNLAQGRPLALLHEVLAPVYLHHRYQVDAAAKMVGGATYEYAVNGDANDEVTPVPAAQQRRAVESMLACIDPETLDLPDEVLAILLPRAFGYGGNRELFDSQTDPVFDPLGVAATASEMVVSMLLNPARCARLVDQHRRAEALPSLDEVLDGLVGAAFDAPEDESARHREIRHAVQDVVVESMIDLAMNDRATSAVRARADAALRRLRGRLDDAGSDHPHAIALRQHLLRYENRELDVQRNPSRPPAQPPGSPIGMEFGYLGGCSHGG